MRLVIGGKPVSVNTSYRTRGRGRGSKNIYLDPKVRAYKTDVGWQSKVQWKHGLLLGDMEVRFDYYFADKRKHDHLNCNKALVDALEGIVYKNDCQIKISHHYTHYDKHNPRVELNIVILGSHNLSLQ